MPKQKGSNSVADKYEGLCGTRSSFVRSAESYSKMTLPYIMPKNGNKNQEGRNQHGWQSIGAEGVNHLANRMTQALFPVNQSFFTLDVSAELKAQGSDADELQAAPELNHLTRAIIAYFNRDKLRPKIVLALKHLIITGNGLFFRDRGSNFRFFSLKNFVVERDHEDRVKRCIILEKIDYEDLSSDIQSKLKTQRPDRDRRDEQKNKLYTDFRYSYDKDGTYKIKVMQEIEGVSVAEESYDNQDDPLIVLRWNVTDGEEYGRGLIEDYASDLFVVNMLSRARAEGAATMMEVRYLVKRGAAVDIKELNSSENGDAITGEEGDITLLQLDKFADTTLINDVLKEYSERLSRAFLLLSSTIRDSERTTAYEVQKNAQELDVNFGGIYSTLGVDLQQPIARIYINEVLDDDVDGDVLEIAVTTGLAALSGAGEMEKLMQYSQMLVQAAGWPEQVQQEIDWRLYSAFCAKQVNLTSGFMKDESQAAAEQEQAVAGNASDALATSMATKLGGNMADQMTGEQ